jgi:hypothetical protein
MKPDLEGYFVMLMGLVFGLGLGSGAAIVLYLVDRT